MSESPNRAAPQQVASLLALATKLLRAGRPADAIAPLRDAALLQPSNAVIQHDLGLACLEVGRVPDAIAALQQDTTGLTNADSAVDFLKRTARDLVASGVHADRICFIAHRFIPAVASAFL